MTMILHTLTAFYNDCLPSSRKQHFLTQVCQQLQISEQTFYRKLKDPAQFKLLERKAIAEIAGKPLFELFPIEEN